ncbi:hypothetical protein BpHYR1_039167 [Brachionus plicatilis]|uniref:Uncharacterized protein n=1 Tax=Brachionus plicatilis TaxID=10195 RepID=A0A3M7QZK2_BRAPC|nr:hypothetical protein BpHYR1_039167 [Brachionus plicatilis]
MDGGKDNEVTENATGWLINAGLGEYVAGLDMASLFLIFEIYMLFLDVHVRSLETKLWLDGKQERVFFPFNIFLLVDDFLCDLSAFLPLIQLIDIHNRPWQKMFKIGTLLPFAECSLGEAALC